MTTRDDDRDDDDPLCLDCAGSGEGMYDDACERHERWLEISRGCE